jgi:hypothetical protein
MSKYHFISTKVAFLLSFREDDSSLTWFSVIPALSLKPLANSKSISPLPKAY